MLAIRIAIARLRALFRRDATTDEIREELQFHVDMTRERIQASGVGSDDAGWQARRRVGRPLAIREERVA